ncbi:hypothetical protein ACSBR2_035105 [Camellia fascicularis]
MEVVVISRNTIKPSTPTPPNLSHFQLSFLDQIVNRNIVPLIFYYPLGIFEDDSKATNLTRSDQLKKSLADVLTKFYPLAGRLKEDLYIDCNDEGVIYLEAQANCQLSEIVEQPNNHHAELNKLLPCDRLDDAGDVLLAIQVTIFDCGGTAIGMCFSHKIADGLSTSTFVNSWAASARGDHSNIVCPRFDSATHFPPRDMSCYQMSTGITEEKIVAKRFVFSDSSISDLKTKYAVSGGMEHAIQPTRVEALSTFIWSRFAVTMSEEEASPTTYIVTQGVNLRTRMNPPLPESCFGNFSWFAIFTSSMDKTVEVEEEGYGFVTKMREAIKKIDSDYVKKLQEGDTHLNSSKGKGDKSCEEPPKEAMRKMKIVPSNFSSFCKFKLYEVDFGWGRPIWVSIATVPLKNQMVFMPTRSGDGIEVWINLTEVDMAKLEADGEFAKFVS